MAIIVDKVQKRKNIAMSCKDLFLNNCINDITVTQIAKMAGVGKGTVYDYFKNKEEIMFEIVSILMVEHNEQKEEKLSKAKSTKEKIKTFFDFFYEEKDSDLRILYKEFVSVSLSSPHEDMIKFQTDCIGHYYEWLLKIIQDGIDNGELIPQALGLAKGLFVCGDGMFTLSCTTEGLVNVEKDVNQFVDTIFELIEIKEEI